MEIDFFVYSDEDCCNKCRNMILDIEKGLWCVELNKRVSAYNPACTHLDRVLQGFGE